jgi:hypothetical protein
MRVIQAAERASAQTERLAKKEGIRWRRAGEDSVAIRSGAFAIGQARRRRLDQVLLQVCINCGSQTAQPRESSL